MSQALQQHGRDIANGLSPVTHRQGADCGPMVSQSEESDEQEDGLSLSQQIGIGLALLVLFIGGAIAVGGG